VTWLEAHSNDKSMYGTVSPRFGFQPILEPFLHSRKAMQFRNGHSYGVSAAGIS
jgi:hypothetical protein